MQFTTAFIGLLSVASSVMAAPVDTQADSVAARAAPWTIKSFKRSCNATDTECWVSFGVDTQTSPVVNCSYSVKGTKASRKTTDGIACGPYQVSSTWSGAFGDDHGFTTWAVVNHAQKIAAWPAYADSDLVNNVAVTPDRQFAPQNF